jgi:ketosteroid isomerase-like protein
MKRAKRTLPIVAMAMLLTAGSVVDPAFTQADPASALPAASTSTATATEADTRGPRVGARSPEELLRLLGERIEAQDVDGIIALQEPEAGIVNYDGSVIRGHDDIRAFYVDWFRSDPVLTVEPQQTVVAGGDRTGRGRVRDRTAVIMGDYSLEQTAPDGTRETFTGDFCDTVREQRDGTWLYILDDPYPPHGEPASASAHEHH